MYGEGWKVQGVKSWRAFNSWRQIQIFEERFNICQKYLEGLHERRKQPSFRSPTILLGYHPCACQWYTSLIFQSTKVGPAKKWTFSKNFWLRKGKDPDCRPAPMRASET